VVNSGTRVGRGGCRWHIKYFESDDKEFASVSLGQWSGGLYDHKQAMKNS
jgi:hypothetical protein